MRPLNHLVGIRDLSAETIRSLLDMAERCRLLKEQGTVRPLAGKTVALLFFEPSTRTRFSFEMAAKSLGAETMAFQSASSSATKGESLLDTANTLRAIGVDAFVIRHRRVGAAQFLSEHMDVPVINAGDGINEHPTQALLDALTLRDALGAFTNKTVGIVGDVRHSRVARSNCFLLKKLGARVLMSGPGTLCPNSMRALGVSVCASMDEVFNEADALMMLRIQRERLGRAMLPSDAEYTALYGLHAERFGGRKGPSVVLHPAPMNRGVEIDDSTADGEQSQVLRQVQNGVAVRMAVLGHVLGADI